MQSSEILLSASRSEFRGRQTSSQSVFADCHRLDQEAAIEEDENQFNPDEDMRDYDEVARNLPVFCVSSRAYQNMRGRLQKDDFNNDGFRNVEETEIPQLQQHAKKLTESGRAATCRRFLNEMCQLLNSMKMWAANDGSQSILSGREQRKEETILRARLSTLEKVRLPNHPLSAGH